MELHFSPRPLLSLAAATGLLAVLVLPSCVDTEGYADGSVELCDLLRACYGYPNCASHVGGSLDAASSDQRSSWLASLTDKNCLAECSAARRCLNIAPVCLGVGSSCNRAEDCCGFLAGKTSCSAPADGKCCKADGASCTQDEQSVCCAGACDPRTSTCGGIVCLDLDHSCQNNTDCCSGLCSGNVCVENICTSEGGVCKLGDICCDGMQCLTNGGEKGVCGFTPTCRGENEQCVAGGTPEEMCCNGVPCTPIGEAPTTGQYVGICNSESCLPADTKCDVANNLCCTGLTCDPFKKTCGKGCGTTGTSCAAGYECCSGGCADGTCACSDGTCQRNEDCCSGSCIQGACAPQCDVGGATCHDLCKAGVAMPNDGTCKDPAGAGCVAQVCAADAYCCCVKWDDLCVDEAVNDCGVGSKVCGP